jgi:hypothetical protein
VPNISASFTGIWTTVEDVDILDELSLRQLERDIDLLKLANCIVTVTSNQCKNPSFKAQLIHHYRRPAQ